MAFRPTRTPTFRPQLSVRRVYETMEPRSETKETPEAYLLHIYIPGFTRDTVKITYVSPSRTVRVTGERPVRGNIWSRFDKSYPIPENSEPEALQGKFETGVLILTMPKKVAPKQPQEVETAKDQKGVAEEKSQETIPPPPQPTTTKVEEPIEEKKLGATLPSPQKGPSDSKATQEDTSSQTPQKDQEKVVERPSQVGKPQEEVEPKPTPTMVTKTDDEKPQKGQEDVEPKPTATMATKVQTDEKPQKGQEEVEPKLTPTMTKTKTPEQPQKGQEEIEPKLPKTESKIKTDDQPPPKGTEVEAEPKPTITTTLTRKATQDKLQEDNGATTTHAATKEKLEKKKTEGTSAEDGDKKRISKKKDHEKPSSVSTKELAEPSSAPKIPKKEKAPRPKNKGKSSKAKKDSEGSGIRELVGSASQAVTRIAEGKFNEQEKQLVANVGAAFLVLAALGAYVSYRFAP